MAQGGPERIVGATRVFNEDGIIEPFVRHHAALLDLHLFLDNGSTDRTLDILRALQADGIPLHVYQARSPVFAEPVYNTGLYNLALAEGADWVAMLDCDEFIDARRLPQGFRGFLSTVPPEFRCVRVPMVDYLASLPETAHELNPAKRLVLRSAEAGDGKVFIRTQSAGQVEIAAGNHAIVSMQGADMGMVQASLVLAHYPGRSPHQLATKAMVGRLKVLAAGQTYAAQQWSAHYAAPFEALKRTPRAWLAETALSQAGKPVEGLVHDPLEYLGGGLAYTHRTDDEARLIAVLAAYAESLAVSHGRILDRKRLIRGALMADAAVARRLF